MAQLSNDEEEQLARVGPGTPSGEVFRRYWIPVEVSANVEVGSAPRSLNGPKNPLRVKALGEELVLWRDRQGAAHLHDEHCAHRGTSLAYGRVEEGPDCIRCPYHGWAYDSTGQCIDQPCEPPTSVFKSSIRQRTYPVREVGGLVFAYMGPPELEPIFPRFDILVREDGERIVGKGGYVQQCNVFQAMHDNNLDVWHPEVLHNWFSQREPYVHMHHGSEDRPPSPVRYDRTPWGTRDMVLKDTDEPGVHEYYELHTVWPSARANLGALRFATPVDDYNTRWFTVEFFAFGPDGTLPEHTRTQMERSQKRLTMTNAELPHDWFKSVRGWWDYDNRMRDGVLWEDEISCGTQGPEDRHGLPNWDRWNLASSDRGLLLNRRMWRDAVDAVREGRDPVGVIRHEVEDVIIQIPANRILTTWEDGVRMIDQSVAERLAEMAADPSVTSASLVRRV